MSFHDSKRWQEIRHQMLLSRNFYFFTGGGGAILVFTLEVVDDVEADDAAAVFAFFATGSGALNENDAVELK
jgi:hypothetical protein